MKTKIQVTQDIIDAAVFMSEERNASGDYSSELGICETCPISLAFVMAGFPDASVAGNCAWEKGESKSPEIRLPRKAFDAVKLFDSHQFDKLKPFAFTVDF